MRADAPPARLGNYEPLIDLAAGGMGTVHVARHVGAAGFERLVVLKRVHRHLLQNKEFYDMFVDEAKVASLIRHPNVVPVIDVVEERGELFLVMDYVESLSFHALWTAARDAGERLPVPVVVRIVADVLSGLHAAHEATDMQGRSLEVVHRDVSPQNVIVGIDGTSRLIDFGIAKAARRLTVTSGGVLKGKFGYMSPEQLKQLRVDRRADVFAAGVVLFEALTGKKPFPQDDEDALLALLLGDVEDPSALSPDVPPKLDAVVQYALARDRDERFQTAQAFLQALETAVPPAPPREVARYIQRLGADLLSRRRTLLHRILENRAAATPAPIPAEDTSVGVSRTTVNEGSGRVVRTLGGGTIATPRLPLVPRSVAVGGAVALVAVVTILFATRGVRSDAGSADVNAGASTDAAASAGASARTEPVAAASSAQPTPPTSPPSAEASATATSRPAPGSGATPRPPAVKQKPSGDLKPNPYGP
jgi:serine/threonine-protein kinase